MEIREIVKAIMELRGFTYKSLSEKLGKSTPTAVSNRIFSGNKIRIDTLVKMAEAMDCEVVVRSKLKDKSEWKVEVDD